MRVGIMLRHLGDHPGGILVYTRRMVEHLLQLESGHDLFLLYDNPAREGAFTNGGSAGGWANGARVREEVVRTPTRLLWDQWGVHRAARRLKLDVLFNPKYALPLVSDVPGVWVCHGLDWYIMPWGSPPLHRMVHRHLVPRYARHAAGIIAVSESTRRDTIRHLNVPPSRVRTVHLAVDDSFRRRPSRSELERTRREFDLPERFVLFAGQIYPAKNFGRLVRAYARVGPPRGVPLVLAGGHRWMCEDELQLVEELGIGAWVHRLGWVPHEKMPSLYRLADVLLMPSLHEGFGLPVLEAMAAGCPVVTADGHGTAEIVQRCGVTVDPVDTAAIAEGLGGVLDDADLRRQLGEAGKVRAAPFTWQRVARETMDVLERVARGEPIHPEEEADGGAADTRAEDRRQAVG